MTAAPEVDDPVVRVLAWRLANERRAALSADLRAKRIAAPTSPIGKTCHYCPEPATTRDHIVPQSLARRCNVAANIVPACLRCNQVKADKRSACECTKCVEAWRRFGPDDTP